MYVLYYYEYDEDIEKNQFLQKEEFDNLDEAYEKLSDLYEEGEISKVCYENAYISSDDGHKYYSTIIDE